MYDLLKRYYEKGLYNAEALKTFVRAGTLTKEQYKEITGVDYVK